MKLTVQLNIVDALGTISIGLKKETLGTADDKKNRDRSYNGTP